MPNFQFSCPSCSQTIECDTQYGGMQLMCPLCQSEIVAPPAPTAAPPAKKGRLSVTLPPQSHQPAPVPQPTAQSFAPRPTKPPIKKGPVLKIAAAVVIIPLVLYFGWPYAVKLQNKFSDSVDKAGAGSDGGQLGHIAELHSVLDATEPTRFESLDGQYGGAVEAAGTVAPKPVASNLPTVPPVYTLEFDEAEILESRVNGLLSGTEFVPDLVRFDRAGQNYVLHLRQGTNAFADRELLIYLRPKPGESVEASTFEITKIFKPGTPQVVKKWMTGPRRFGQKKYSSGYVMKLELEKIVDGTVPGKIYIALPDPEKTVVAGHFIAETSLVPAGQQVSP